MIDAVRIVLPPLLTAAGLVAFVALMVMAWIHLPFWAAMLSVPAAMILLSCAAILMSAGIKGVLIGTYEPTVKPLWSKFVWLNELVNGVYENIAGSALQPMLGTPFAVFGLRLMGCKIGRRVFMDTTLFSEFDLAEIGAYAAVNYGATIQTHLFEDRIMKADRLEIGEGASVGNMAVVLYGTEMKLGACLGSLSVLMKGEKLAPLSRWYGIPTQPMPALDQAANRRGAEPCLAAAGVRSRLRLAAPADRGPARPMPDAVPARRGVPNRHLAEAA